MRAHGIIKFQLGRRANCSSMDYMWVPFVGTVAYLAFFAVAIAVEAIVAKRLRSASTAVWLWVGANLVAIVALIIWASSTGMMNYGSAVCIFPIVGVPLLLMGITIPLIRRLHRAGRPQPSLPDNDEGTSDVEQPADVDEAESGGTEEGS